MNPVRKFLAKNLVLEIVFLAISFLLFWMVTRVQPNGFLSESGYKALSEFQRMENFVWGFISSSKVQGLGIVPPRSEYEISLVNGFCEMASFAGIYVKNGSSLSYFFVIPMFLIIIFAYNKAGPDSFSRPSRVLISIIIILLILVVTFKIIELQNVQASIVSIASGEFLLEEYNYRCEAQIIKLDGEPGVAQLALFLGNFSAFLSEFRLYLLGLVLWIIGKEHADIRKMQISAQTLPRPTLGENHEVE